ncbi:MAG: RHS repeat-associated core domain-containing protein, partial [Candidatus Helarchaeota archaeon]
KKDSEGQEHYYLKDHPAGAGQVSGNSRQMSGENMRRDYALRHKASLWDYPYGEAYIASGDGTNYLFTGKPFDEGTGLYYFGARYYDPGIGRWYVPDPAGQYFSPYVYCENSPLDIVDFDGRSGWGLFAAYLGIQFVVNSIKNVIWGPQFDDPTSAGFNNGFISSNYNYPDYRDHFGNMGIGNYSQFYNQNSHLIETYYPGSLYGKFSTSELKDLIVHNSIPYSQSIYSRNKIRGFINSLPNTVFGFGAVGLNELITGSPDFVGFDAENWVWGYKNTWYPFGEGDGWITLGHTVLANNMWKGGFGRDVYSLHELFHVYQSDIFGITFFPIYIGNWGVNLIWKGMSAIEGGKFNAYLNILFEIWAQHFTNGRR